MPFTVNVGPYVGGQLMAQGLGNLGSGIGEGIASIGKAIAENKKMEQEQGADQVIFNYAKQQGLVTPEIEQAYLEGSHSAKTGIIGGLTRQFAMANQQKQVDSLEEQRQSSVEERGQRTSALKTAQENSLLASEPPSLEERTKAQQNGYDYLLNPKTQTYDLMPMQGGPSGVGGVSDKVQMTLPDGRTVLVTGNKAVEMQQPIDFKKHYGITQSQFSDPTATQRGFVDEEGQFKQDPNGDYVRVNVHKDKTSGIEVDSGKIPYSEWNQNRNAPPLKAPSGPATAPSGTPAPTSTPPRGKVTAGGKQYQPGDKINLKNGKTVTFLGYDDDGKLRVQ